MRKTSERGAIVDGLESLPMVVKRLLENLRYEFWGQVIGRYGGFEVT